jgi:hypothetical protein
MSNILIVKVALLFFIFLNVRKTLFVMFLPGTSFAGSNDARRYQGSVIGGFA